jgi:phosphoglycerate dehydrogenase-like enzyme
MQLAARSDRGSPSISTKNGCEPSFASATSIWTQTLERRTASSCPRAFVVQSTAKPSPEAADRNKARVRTFAFPAADYIAGMNDFHVLVTEGSDRAPLDWLKSQVRVTEIATDDPGFDAALKTAHGMVVRTYTKVNQALLDRAPLLRVVGRGGVGIENIDVRACRARNVEVVYTPDANTLAVGDYVFGLILQLIRPYAIFKDTVYDAKTFKKIRDVQRGRQLNEMTLGILGMGRVGKRVGRIASQGFGMRVLYNDLLDVASDLTFPATAVDKPTLYAESDILTLHIDMKPGNEKLVGESQLRSMKPGSILLNTCRGEVLDEHALARAIRDKHLAGAALDVYAPEPPPADFPLLGLDNVLLAPHMAARTHTAIENMSWVVRDVVDVLRGKIPQFPAPSVL